MAEIPSDVVLARGVRMLRTATLGAVGSALLLTLVMLAAVLLAAPDQRDPLIVAGSNVVSWAAAISLAAAAFCTWGQLDVLHGQGKPTDVVAALRATHRRLAWFPRLIIAGCVVAITAWLLIDQGGFIGTLVGAAVAVQAALVLRFLRDGVLDPARLVESHPPLSRRIREYGRR